MDDKDSFLTQGYKDGFVHSCYNRTKKVREYTAQLGHRTMKCATAQAARVRITKWMKESNGRESVS